MRLASLLPAVLTFAACGPDVAWDDGNLTEAEAPLSASSTRSAARRPGEDWEAAYARTAALNPPVASAFFGRTAKEAAVPLALLDDSSVPEWSGAAQLKAGFTAARDPRFIPTRVMMRRVSWLFPDDGCWIRAELAALRLAKAEFPRPAKVFAFGNLVVASPNAGTSPPIINQPFAALDLDGDGGVRTVRWAWHVAPIVRVGNVRYVIDPAIEPMRPLPLREWLLRMVPSVADVKVAICSPYTAYAQDGCEAPPADEAATVREQREYLAKEWGRQVDLGRDPRAVLGESPPWRTGE